MGRHFDHDTLVLWMHLVNAGGYTTAKQLRNEALPERATQEVIGMLNRLVANRMARAKRERCKHTTFGVTTMCVAPPGYEHLMQPAAAQGAAP